ncbi:cytochrome P450 [Moorena producens JHB]|uniref:Cytochrome P450 n=2 Tax=Cyanophyceae TaxID=3028117 RepID=A0A1D9FXU0_MOOP1|nr:cytochrome P450 [Moorena producens]AAY42400.1 HctH [Lyngbya majuscula]AOY80188.2 cytochrome P450 [Moorena producens JHB]
MMKFPDGPKTPALLQSINLIVNPLNYLEDCAKRYGDIFTIRFLNYPPTVLVSHPQAMKEIFTASSQTFNTGEAMKELPTAFTGENALPLLDGDLHKHRKRMLMPAFHGERLRAYSELIYDLTKQEIEQWTKGEPFHVQASMQDISLKFIIRAIFGVNDEDRFQQFKKTLISLLNLLSDPWTSIVLYFRALQQDWGSWSLWGRFVRLRQQVDDIIYAEIKRRRDDPALLGEDILSLMMSARNEQGELINDVELRDDLMILLLGGHETTSMSMTWALYWIHHFPQVYETLMAELDTLDDYQDSSAIMKLPYLDAVCHETLRIYPPTILGAYRIAQKPVEIMSHKFEAGTFILPCIYLTHRQEDLYPEPNHFRPERFLERQFSAYEFVAFGGGSRRCIGYALSLFEMKLILATILTNLKLALPDNRVIKPVRSAFTVAPSPMYMIRA